MCKAIGQYGLLTLLLFLSLPQIAVAWGPLGHQVICDKIRQQLEQAAIRQGFTTFASACLWPDRVRGQQQYRWTSALHYINVPRDQSQIDMARDCSFNIHHTDKPACVVDAIPYYMDQWKASIASDIKGGSNKSGPNKVNRNKDASPDDKALLFLAHFVADVHQPLHVSYKDDRGGNRTSQLFNDRKPMSLHRWWDSGLLKCTGSRSWQKRGKHLYRGISAEQKSEWLDTVSQHQNANPSISDLQTRVGSRAKAWANESLALTRTIYGKRSSIDAREECKQYSKVVNGRLQRAGIRLAFLIERVLGKEANR